MSNLRSLIFSFFIYLIWTAGVTNLLHLNLIFFKIWFILRIFFLFTEYMFSHVKENHNLCISILIFCFSISYIGFGLPISSELFRMSTSPSESHLLEHLGILIFMGNVLLCMDLIVVFTFTMGFAVSWIIFKVCK